MNAPSPTKAIAPRVQLFILSRDRKDYCREVIVSALAQDYSNLEIIISDNSIGEDVAQMVTAEFPEVVLLRRIPNLPALGHFNRLIEEAQAPLMVLFHDDDVLEPSYISRMVEYHAQHPDAAAVGCNAYFMRHSKTTSSKLMGDFSGERILRSKIDLVEPYLSLSLIDPAPFPGYMYRTDTIKGLRLDSSKGGKHADVSFLCEVLDRAPIVWTEECLFNYRLHGANDSYLESIGQRLSWLRYIQSATGLSRTSQPVRDYKFMYWRRWLNQNSPGLRPFLRETDTACFRRAVARRFVVFWGLRLALTRIDFWKRTVRQLLRK